MFLLPLAKKRARSCFLTKSLMTKSEWLALSLLLIGAIVMLWLVPVRTVLKLGSIEEETEKG